MYSVGMKRLCVFLFLSTFLSLVFAAPPLDVHVEVVYPNQIQLSWQEVEGAEYYDLYLNKEPKVHTQETKTVLGSNERPLVSHTEYEVLIAARKQGVGGELAVERVMVETPGWEGRYRWVNLSGGDDNKGKCRQLDYLVSYEEGSYVIHGLFEKPYQLYPLVPSDRIGEQIPYEGDSPHQIAYRLNAEIFNTTNFKPKSWSVKRIDYSDDRVLIEIETKVGMMRFSTISMYRFLLASNGKQQLHFETEGSGIASWGGLFKNPPNPGDAGVFKCTILE